MAIHTKEVSEAIWPGRHSEAQDGNGNILDPAGLSTIDTDIYFMFVLASSENSNVPCHIG